MIIKMDFLHLLPICLLAVFSTIPAGLGIATVGEPWPMPQEFTVTTDTLILSDSTFQFQSMGHYCDVLEEAFDRYFKLIFYAGKRKNDYLRFTPTARGAMLEGLAVTVSKPCEQYPYTDMDESYDLKIAERGSSLTAASVWGALRGLETFSQLVYETETDQFQVNCTEIQDFPRFAWRGVLLDSSRHFLAKEAIMQNLEAMAFNKMNVFHWHIVDSNSFPYQSRDYPNLSQKGAYDPYTHIYSQEDIKEIIEFARLRGIRVVPEFDTPGHSTSWGKGQPGLLAQCYKQGKFAGDYGPIDPSVNSTYTFLKGFMKEVTEVFPDKYVHLGGDEVSFNCWKSNPQIQAFMKAKGFGDDYAKLEEYYIQNLLEIVSSYNSGYVIWQEVVDNGVKVSPDTVVEVWKKKDYQGELAKVTNHGFRTILSSCWYLSKISFGSDWMSHYQCDPQNFTGTAQQKKLVIGGEMCLWGEFIDATNVISRGWPRGSAVAERLWSAESMKSPNKAMARLEEHRCRMIRRGLPVEPVNGPGVCKYEYIPRL